MKLRDLEERGARRRERNDRLASGEDGVTESRFELDVMLHALRT